MKKVSCLAVLLQRKNWGSSGREAMDISGAELSQQVSPKEPASFVVSVATSVYLFAYSTDRGCG